VKTDCTLTPIFGILRPIPDGLRKSKTLIESGVQNTPSFPSASAEVALHSKANMRTGKNFSEAPLYIDLKAQRACYYIYGSAAVFIHDTIDE
jgi:hypothetical protein